MRRIVVRRSPVDGRGVFALTNIQSGELLVHTRVKWHPGASRASAINATAPRMVAHFSSDWMTDTLSTAGVVAILHAGLTIAASRTVRQSKRGVARLSGRSLTSWSAKSCSSTIGSTSKAAARLPSKSSMLVGAARCTAEERCSPNGKSDRAFWRPSHVSLTRRRNR